MTIHTKKYRLEPNKYIRLALWYTLRRQWWVFPLLIILGGTPAAYMGNFVWFSISLLGLALYLFFWLMQFYSVITMNKLLFERISYEITHQHVTMQITSKHGMVIPWNNIKKVKVGKKDFSLIISSVQFIYLPHKIFGGQYEIDFLHTLLKRKKFCS